MIGSEGSRWVGEGRNYFFVFVSFRFRSSQLLSVGHQPFRAIPRCAGPCGLPGPLRVASLIPGGSTAGPLRVFGSRGPGGVAYIGVLNCEGLSFVNCIYIYIYLYL